MRTFDSTFDSSIGDRRLLSAATVKSGWETAMARHKMSAATVEPGLETTMANPHVQAMIAQRAAHLQRTAEYTPEQQEEIWAARLMAGSGGHNLLRRLKLPSHLVR